MAIEPDQIRAAIAEAETLPGSFYTDPATFERLRERVFARSWQFVGDIDQVKVPGQVVPTTVLEGCVDEPVLLTRDTDDRLHCLSNVCTHRGMLVCEAPSITGGLRCRYHGRRFALDGRFVSMPEFEAARDFPRPSESLPALPLRQWGKLLFTSVTPLVAFDEVITEVEARVGWLPLGQAVCDPSRSREYLVRANWALYCDNYLEGFHVPFVHAGLAAALDYTQYRTELFRWSNVQVGVASGGGATFDLPQSSPDDGQSIAAYYFWVFPNTMINVYPWGISLNVVRPLAVDRTRVSFLSYVWDPAHLGAGASVDLDRVEREDEVVVEAVQRGVRSRLYSRGRYSPARETGVHHFHRLLMEHLA